MTWCPTQVCDAVFVHGMHVWALGDEARYCPGVWTQPNEPDHAARLDGIARCADCGRKIALDQHDRWVHQSTDRES